MLTPWLIGNAILVIQLISLGLCVVPPLRSDVAVSGSVDYNQNAKRVVVLRLRPYREDSRYYYLTVTADKMVKLTQDTMRALPIGDSAGLTLRKEKFIYEHDQPVLLTDQSNQSLGSDLRIDGGTIHLPNGERLYRQEQTDLLYVKPILNSGIYTGYEPVFPIDRIVLANYGKFSQDVQEREKSIKIGLGLGVACSCATIVSSQTLDPAFTCGAGWGAVAGFTSILKYCIEKIKMPELVWMDVNLGDADDSQMGAIKFE